MNIISELEAAEAERINAIRTIPEFSAGDTLRVNVKVTEGTRTRVQAYEGVCIARSGAGIQENFTVRKISYGEGVERVFPVYSPMLDSVEVVRRGKVRRAKLYYLRDRRGNQRPCAQAERRGPSGRRRRARPRQGREAGCQGRSRRVIGSRQFCQNFKAASGPLFLCADSKAGGSPWRVRRGRGQARRHRRRQPGPSPIGPAPTGAHAGDRRRSRRRRR